MTHDTDGAFRFFGSTEIYFVALGVMADNHTLYFITNFVPEASDTKLLAFAGKFITACNLPNVSDIKFIVSYILPNASDEVPNVSAELPNTSDIENIAIVIENIAIDIENIAIDTENIAIVIENIAIDTENIAIDIENIAADIENIAAVGHLKALRQGNKSGTLENECVLCC